MNTQVSLLATISHHIMHYSIIFWIRGLSCTLCSRRISEKDYYVVEEFSAERQRAIISWDHYLKVRLVVGIPHRMHSDPKPRLETVQSHSQTEDEN